MLRRLDRQDENNEPETFGVPNYQRVRDAIRADIARGTLASSARLKISELSARYGLSPAPIREALNQLAAEGWVVINPNRGAQVRAIDETFFREMNEIRVALESYTVGLCAAAATSSDVDRLEAIEDEYEATLAKLTPGSGGGESTRGVEAAALVRINARLHAAIRALHPNRETEILINRYAGFFNTMRVAWGYGSRRPQQMAEEHRELLAAFRAKNPAAAEPICRRHIGHAMEDLLAVWRRGHAGP